MDLATDRAREPNRWVRYWTVVTANERKEHHAWTLARAQGAGRGHRRAPAAALPSAGRCWRPTTRTATRSRRCCGASRARRSRYRRAIATWSKGQSTRRTPRARRYGRCGPRRWRRRSTSVQAIVDAAPFASYTWDAVSVMARFGGTSRAPEASHTLARFVVTNRRRREYYDMVGLAVRAIGRLGIAQTDLLMAELDSASPGVAVRGRRRAQSCCSPRPRAVERILDVATLSADRDDKLASALRGMQRAAVVETAGGRAALRQHDPEDSRAAAADRARRLGGDRPPADPPPGPREPAQGGGRPRRPPARAHPLDRPRRRRAATWISVGMWIVVFLVGVSAISAGLLLTFRAGL